MEHSIIYYPGLTIALALCLGMIAQALAHHMRVPGIVFLLAVGVLFGPDGAGIVQPASLGPGLNILIGFAVAVILFEGGLNLKFKRLKRSQRSILSADSHWRSCYDFRCCCSGTLCHGLAVENRTAFRDPGNGHRAYSD